MQSLKHKCIHAERICHASNDQKVADLYINSFVYISLSAPSECLS